MRYVDPRRNKPTGYDVAEVCLNGHDITASAGQFPEHREKHCSQCGAATITECPSCNSSIRGHLLDSMVLQYAAPSFCHECGNMLVPMPPLTRQVQVREYLDKATKKLRSLVQKINLSIDRLHEYRTALISAGVAGKIDLHKEVA